MDVLSFSVCSAFSFFPCPFLYPFRLSFSLSLFLVFFCPFSSPVSYVRNLSVLYVFSPCPFPFFSTFLLDL